MLYDMCHVRLYNMCQKYVMLYNIKYVMLCYFMTSKWYFISMQLCKSVLLALGEKYKTALIY